MRLLTIAIAASVTGCATSGTQIQADCETISSDLVAIVRCTKDTLAKKNPAKLQDAKAKLYLLRGEQLAADVAAGRMSNIDARVAWQKIYVDLWDATPQESAERMKLLAQMLQQQQRQQAESGYKIVQPPVTTVCISGTYLGQVRTDCKSQ